MDEEKLARKFRCRAEMFCDALLNGDNSYILSSQYQLMMLNLYNLIKMSKNYIMEHFYDLSKLTVRINEFLRGIDRGIVSVKMDDGSQITKFKGNNKELEDILIDLTEYVLKAMGMFNKNKIEELRNRLIARIARRTE